MYNAREEYSQNVLGNLADICKDSDIVGFSVLTNDFFRASSITKHLKSRIKAPIVWGGIHSSIAPESCPHEVDYIYIGEGEAGMLELVDRIKHGRSASDMKNLYYWEGDILRKNPLRPLLKGEELKHVQDFELDRHFVLDKDRIVKVTYDLVRKNFYHDFENDDTAYLAVFSRGCVHGCTYCCNNKLNKLYNFEKTVYRTMTARGMIDELKYVIDKFPFVKFIYINDDNFLANDIKILREFADLYTKEIALPFKALGSPVYVTEDKIKALKAAGLKEVHIGVQSGSNKTNKEIYRRSIPSQSVLRTASLIHKYDLRGRYDFIFDNPYESPEDGLETARLILQLPKPYILQPFSLTFFPGTELYDRAKRDGKLVDECSQVFEKITNEFYVDNTTYLKLVSVLLPRIPYSVGKILVSRPAVFLFHRNAFKVIYKYVYILLQFVKSRFNLGVKSVYKRKTL
jgi:radical SAM superfamily enzyme YgiQ (UPF0313 family)